MAEGGGNANYFCFGSNMMAERMNIERNDAEFVSIGYVKVKLLT